MASSRSASTMASAAQQKLKLFKEIEELKKKVAETDDIRVELQECKEELVRRDALQEQLEQWKQDFQEGAKHMNKMKRETQEAKDLAISYKRKLREQQLRGGELEGEVKRLKDSLKIAEAVRDGTVKKGRQQDKRVKKMQQHTRVHESLRIGAEEELRKTKQFLDQERSFRLQDLHRHNEAMEATEELEKARAKLEGDKVKVVKEVVGQRARVRKLQSELEASKLITVVADRDITMQNREIEELKVNLLELKRVVEEKNREIGVWARRFMELESEYHRVQHQLAQVAVGASSRSHVVTRGSLARHGAAATAISMTRGSASLTQSDLHEMGIPAAATVRSLHLFRARASEGTAFGECSPLMVFERCIWRTVLTTTKISQRRRSCLKKFSRLSTRPQSRVTPLVSFTFLIGKMISSSRRLSMVSDDAALTSN